MEMDQVTVGGVVFLGFYLRSGEKSESSLLVLELYLKTKRSLQDGFNLNSAPPLAENKQSVTKDHFSYVMLLKLPSATSIHLGQLLFGTSLKLL